jgi:tetratricopeptide (TPR) repeat protein
MENGNSIYEKYPCYPPAFCVPYYMGVSLLVMYKQTKKKAYKKKAKFFAEKLDAYVKRGNPNAQHYQIGLEAEMLALKHNHDEAIRKFERAIAIATRGGYMHDAALLNERYGEFVLQRGDHDRGMYHLNIALRLYAEWGASMKVQLLSRKYGLCEYPENVVANSI